MLKDQIPTGILKVDYDIPLLGEIGGGNTFEALSCISDKLKNLPKEASFVLCLDTYYRPICVGLLGYGTENNVEMSVKETVQFALLTNARAVITIHNHPGNGRRLTNILPSNDDIACASRIAEALKLFEIELNDSIIINSEWTKPAEYMSTVYKIDNPEEQKRYLRLPAFYSMREHFKYRGIFNPDPDKKINLKNPEYSGPDNINTEENKKYLAEFEYALNC